MLIDNFIEHKLLISKDCGEVGSEMTNQLLTNHRECNCEEEATAAATSSTTNGDPGAAYSLPTITLTEHDTSANEQINEVRRPESYKYKITYWRESSSNTIMDLYVII